MRVIMDDTDLCLQGHNPHTVGNESIDQAWSDAASADEYLPEYWKDEPIVLRTKDGKKMQAMNVGPSPYGEHPERMDRLPKDGGMGHAPGRWILAVGLVIFLVYYVFFREPEAIPGYGTNFNIGVEDEARELPALRKLDPFSTVNPVEAGLLPAFERPEESSPSSRMDPLFLGDQDEDESVRRALPTNSWYENLLLLDDGEEPKANQHRAYTMPYVVDVAGPIPGIRVFDASDVVLNDTDTILLATDAQQAMTIGVESDQRGTPGQRMTSGYDIMDATDLALSLKWEAFPMRSSIVRGMPMATMIYPSRSSEDDVLPTLFVPKSLRTTESVLVDTLADKEKYNCLSDTPFTVQEELELTFIGGKEWMVFFSRPVTIFCRSQLDSFYLQVVDEEDDADDLAISIALVFDPVIGLKPEYKEFLRLHSDSFPGGGAWAHYAVDDAHTTADITFDWDRQTLRKKDIPHELMMFALPHHIDILDSTNAPPICTQSFHGPACIAVGNRWNMKEVLPPVSFRAPRQIDAKYLDGIITSVNNDLTFRIPDQFASGAGDPYFSGKSMAKVARILMIANEILTLCDSTTISENTTAICEDAALPTQAAMRASISHLRDAVDVWLSGSGEGTFVYDQAWGGTVHCGCDLVDGKCTNSFPECPAFDDPMLAFGSGFYNDHHFHYGYHIYAAAAVAYFDSAWAEDNFEQVLLLVRDIANPSAEDEYFPQTRHKDWYQGSSWASGIGKPASPNGMNQESSSEAIAAYEAVSLFGSTMYSVFSDANKKDESEIAAEIHNVGLVLLSTEIRAAQKYWQVTRANRIYPAEYQHGVVGVMWTTEAKFTTWFGDDPAYVYGIQLLPLTPIAETRDSNQDWLKEIFEPFASACGAECVNGGWSVQILAVLASIGHQQEATDLALELPQEVFDTSGGDGHSRSNTLWYIATRPDQEEAPLPDEYPWELTPDYLDCHQPATCTEAVLNKDANGFTCRSRIEFLLYEQGFSEWDACLQVTEEEYPLDCGECSPFGVQPDHKLNVTDATVHGADVSSCFNPQSCTDEVLNRIAKDETGLFTCKDRIQFLIDNEELNAWDACTQVSIKEFPRTCGACNPTTETERSLRGWR